MAQDLLKNPTWKNAVITKANGFYAVNYEMLGLKMIYLEAGSGAQHSVPIQMIEQVKQNINIQAVSLPTATTAEVVRSNIQLHYLEMPLEIRWRNASPESHKFWRVHAGFKASYLLGGKFNYESGLTGNGTENIKNVLNKFQYGVYLSFGFNTWNPYIYYGLNPIFDDNKTAIENNISALNIGLKFYIL
jgi:hypothetical protein